MSRVFFIVLRHEWTLVRAERTLMGALLLFAAAAGYAAVMGHSWSTQRRTAMTYLAESSTTETRALGRQLDRLSHDTTPPPAFGDPRSPYTAGTRAARQFAVLPATALGSAAVGQSDLFPFFRRVSMISRETFFVNDEIENPVNLLAGRFDLAFVAVVLLPLIILALTYNVLSADREAGTLAMLLSQPTSGRQLVGAKVAARALIVFGTIVVAFAICLVASGANVVTPDGLARVGLWLFVVLSYAALWLSIALAVNVVGRTSATNAVVLLAIWLTATVLVPALVNVTVSTLHPVPSRVALVQATRDASDAATASGSQLLGMYYQDHPELMAGGVPTDEFGPRSIAVQEQVERTTRPIKERFQAQLDRQEQLVRRWRFASPAFLVHDALTDIAGTSAHRYRSYELQVDAYMRQLHAFFTPMVVRGARFTSADLARVPRFTFQDVSAPALARRLAPALVALLVGAIAVAWLGLARAGRASALAVR
jgi:ABC-2 type transport system permease protein